MYVNVFWRKRGVTLVMFSPYPVSVGIYGGCVESEDPRSLILYHELLAKLKVKNIWVRMEQAWGPTPGVLWCLYNFFNIAFGKRKERQAALSYQSHES